MREHRRTPPADNAGGAVRKPAKLSKPKYTIVERFAQAELGGLRVIQDHYCPRAHRSYQRAARCIFPRLSVYGDGPFALLVQCSIPSGVILFPWLPTAQWEQEQIESGQSDFCCFDLHTTELVVLGESVRWSAEERSAKWFT